MPNVGKPSKGCKNCRDRKVKCDQKRPSCSQCVRINKQCHGYRDPFEMMFRDESNVVARKAKIKYKELSKGKTSTSQDQGDAQRSDDEDSAIGLSPASTSRSEQQLAQSTRDWTPLRVLEPSLEDQAIGFFFSSYVQRPSFVPRGAFDFLPQMLGQPQADPILHTSVSAAGLAGFANTTKCQTIMKQAREQYVKALRMTNNALQKANTATRNSTLISVIMLGMYENFMFQNMESIKSWAKHVDGACALLALRGEAQLHDDIGIRLFRQFYGTVLLVATENGTAVPKAIADLWETNTTFGDYSVQGKHWTTEMIRFLRRAIDLNQDTTSDPVAVVASATRIDKELEDIRELIPNIWKYETVHIEKPVEHVYGNSYHIYLDPWIAQMWNNLRSVRLFIHRIIRTQLKKGMEQLPPLFTKEQVQSQLTSSERIVRITSAGICASTPQISGQIPFPNLPATRLSPSTAFTDLFDPSDPMFKLHPPGNFLIPLKPTGMHNLIWPIYSAASAEPGCGLLRQWAIDRLYFLAFKIGTRQAVVLAEDLKEANKSGFIARLKPDD